MSRLQDKLQPGDIVGISLPVISRQTGLQTGTVIATRGQVVKVYREGSRGNWRAKVYPEDPVKWFNHTGHTDWQYVHMLTLISRVDKPPRRRYP